MYTSTHKHIGFGGLPFSAQGTVVQNLASAVATAAIQRVSTALALICAQPGLQGASGAGLIALLFRALTAPARFEPEHNDPAFDLATPSTTNTHKPPPILEALSEALPVAARHWTFWLGVVVGLALGPVLDIV